ncbi:hypothetical protein KSP39_PZI003532 [Platanthera zijinensis]|uniref:Uncharacterized protein n=1 Tax=Platanthera zijinensis TaxID=2320716 RepID=A0AAP0BU38_9ASPA
MGKGRGEWRRPPIAVFLIFFTPVLLPFLCLSLPPFLIVSHCIRLIADSSSRRKRSGVESIAVHCENSEAAPSIVGPWLLRRYLDDQLRLVAGSVLDPSDSGEDLRCV